MDAKFNSLEMSWCLLNESGKANAGFLLQIVDGKDFQAIEKHLGTGLFGSHRPYELLHPIAIDIFLS